MPDAELRRQRAAYQQGVVKTALPAAWIMLLPLIAGGLVGYAPERARMIVAFLVYGLTLAVLGTVALGMLYRPPGVSLRLVIGISAIGLIANLALGPLVFSLHRLEDFSVDKLAIY